jgi:hypothetical protein
MEAASLISPAVVKNGKFSLLNGVTILIIFLFIFVKLLIILIY